MHGARHPLIRHSIHLVFIHSFQKSALYFILCFLAFLLFCFVDCYIVYIDIL